MRKMIAAIDPGVNTGVALVDLDSDYFYVFSGRDASRLDMINRIFDIGRAVVVTTDRASSRKRVKSIAHALNARAYFHKRDLKRIEKANALKYIDARFKNQHEKDALATALITKRKLSKLMEKIENRLSRKGLGYLSSDVNEIVLRNKISMKMALDEII